MKIESSAITITFESAPHIAKVQSESDSDKSYNVITYCECDGFRYNGRCKHIDLVASVPRSNVTKIDHLGHLDACGILMVSVS